MKRLGQIGIPVILTLCGGLIVGTFVALNYVDTKVSQAVAPIEQKVETNEGDIASIRTDISWIKSSLIARGYHPGTSTDEF